MTLENRIANLASAIKIKERILAEYRRPEKTQLYHEIEDDKELLELLKELKIYKENTKNTPKWMRELRAYREAHEEIKALPQVWEEGDGIQKCLRCIERWLEETRGEKDDNR